MYDIVKIKNVLLLLLLPFLLLLRLFTLPNLGLTTPRDLQSQMSVGQMPVGGAIVSGPES